MTRKQNNINQNWEGKNAEVFTALENLSNSAHFNMFVSIKNN